MADLTPRQIAILKNIVEEFIATARPVGSQTLEKRLSLGVCPATIRNEMVRLTEMGYLYKAHASSGRLPTTMGLKFYVHQLMEPAKLSVAEEIGIKNALWEQRQRPESLLRQAARELARRSRQLALTISDQGDFYLAGAANLLEEPEFFDIDVTKSVLTLIDQADFWQHLLETAFQLEEDNFSLLLGAELGEGELESCGLVYHRYQLANRRGLVATLGPARLKYQQIIPLVNYFAKILAEIGRG